MHDVIIIGAGPAGATAARALAERGHDVVVLEEHERVGDPVHCTGVLGIEAFDELDLPRDTILTVVSAARFTGAAGHSVLVEGDTVRGAVVDRGRFDRCLADRAAAAGACIVTNRRADRLEISRDAVTVHAGDASAPIRARACVLACGANYRFNRALGLGVPRLFAQSAQVQVPFPALPHVQVWLGREVAPAGFAWLVPFRRDAIPTARIGLTCNARALPLFNTLSTRLGLDSGVDVRAWPAPRLRMLPLAPVTKTYGRRLLAVGDAAGLLKPTTGGGIYYALISASIAADVLDGALGRDRLDEADLREYEVEWRRRLWPEIRAGLVFRRVATRLTDSAIDALIELARVDGIIPLLKRTAHFNWHRKAALALLRHPAFRRVILTNLLY